MSADQAQFQQLLSSLLSMDNEVRKQAEVSAKYYMKIKLFVKIAKFQLEERVATAQYSNVTHIYSYI